VVGARRRLFGTPDVVLFIITIKRVRTWHRVSRDRANLGVLLTARFVSEKSSILHDRFRTPECKYGAPRRPPDNVLPETVVTGTVVRGVSVARVPHGQCRRRGNKSARLPFGSLRRRTARVKCQFVSSVHF